MNDYLSKSVVAVDNASQIDIARAGRVYIMTQDSGAYQKGDMLKTTGSSVDKINSSPVEKEFEDKLLELSALGSAVFGIEPNVDSMANAWQGFVFEWDDIGYEFIKHSQLAEVSGVSIGSVNITYACPYMNSMYATTYINKGGTLLPADYKTTGNRKNHLIGVKKLDVSVNKIGSTKVEYQAKISADYAAKVGNAFPSNHTGFVGTPNLRYANFENIVDIPSWAMQTCSALQYVRCDKLSSMGGNSTFASCRSLSVLDFSHKQDDVIPTFIGTVSNTFQNCGANTPAGKTYVLVPEHLLQSWSEQWSQFSNNLNIVSALPG